MFAWSIRNPWLCLTKYGPNGHETGAMNPRTPGSFGCQHCGRSNFVSQYALKQHQRSGFCAKVIADLAKGRSSPMSVDTKGSNTDVQQDEDWEPLPYLPPSTPTRKQPKSRFEMDGIETHVQYPGLPLNNTNPGLQCLSLSQLIRGIDTPGYKPFTMDMVEWSNHHTVQYY